MKGHHSGNHRLIKGLATAQPTFCNVFLPITSALQRSRGYDSNYDVAQDDRQWLSSSGAGEYEKS